MAGLSPGTSVEPHSLSGETSGAREACPSPCNRGCAPLECTVDLPRSIRIDIRGDKFLKVRSWRDGSMERRKLSLDNFVRTISTCAEVEEVCINGYSGVNKETFKALCESLRTTPSLKSLHLREIILSPLSVSDAEAIFSVLGTNSTLQMCSVGFDSREPTEAASVKVLVDALLQNQFLQKFTLQFWGQGDESSRASKEAVRESGAMRELSRYLTAPTNVLTKLEAWNLTDDEVIQLADTLGLNKKLQKLWIERTDSLHGEGIRRLGEALRTNTALERIGIGGTKTRLGDDEMKSLVGALIPDATSGLQPNTHLHSLRFACNSIEGKEGMEQLATLLRSNTSLLLLGVRLTVLGKESPNVAQYVEMLCTALQFNASLESLDLWNCSGIGGTHVLEMIMDMLLHNHTLRKIKLTGTGLEKDGDDAVVHAELRTRDGWKS